MSCCHKPAKMTPRFQLRVTMDEVYLRSGESQKVHPSGRDGEGRALPPYFLPCLSLWPSVLPTHLEQADSQTERASLPCGSPDSYLA